MFIVGFHNCACALIGVLAVVSLVTVSSQASAATNIQHQPDCNRSFDTTHPEAEIVGVVHKSVTFAKVMAIPDHFDRALFCNTVFLGESGLPTRLLFVVVNPQAPGSVEQQAAMIMKRSGLFPT